MKFDKKWLVGFLESTSEFNIIIKDNNPKEILLEFRVFSSDIKLLYGLKKFFGCGRVYSNNIFIITNFEHLFNIVLPFLIENSFVSDKKFEFFKFRKCIDIMSNNSRLSDSNFLELEKLSFDIKKNRKNK